MKNNKTIHELPSIAVVVPVKNEAEYIDKCLRSLVEQDYPADKISIVVVDNGSTDETRDIVRRYSARVKLLEKTEGTVAALRNYGAQYRDSELVAFLDGDCVAPVDWLRVGYNILIANKQVSCVGFKSSFPEKHSSWVAKVWHEMSSSSKYSGTVAVNWLSSFNLLIKKNFFDKIHGFDEKLVTCEDYDLGIRLNKHSNIIFSDSIHISHLGVVNGVLEFFNKELWRGKNSLDSFVKEKLTPSSFIGIAIPVWQVMVTLFFVFNLCFIVIPISFSVFFLCICPILMALRKLTHSNWKYFIQIVMLYMLYLNARGLAFVGGVCRK